MLAGLRRGLNTWIARLFFMVLVAAFGLWGVADVVRNLGGSDGSVATVGDRKIQMPELQEVYRRQLAEVTKMFGGKIDPTPEIRRSVAAQSIDRLVTQSAIDQSAANLGIVASDAAVRQTIFDMPAFKGTDGKFSRPQFDNVLRNNGLTEQHFLQIMRSDLMQRQLLDAVAAGASVSDTETRQVYAFQNEKRVADSVDIAFASMPDPAAPTEAQLQRWYDNHPDKYRTPELRRVKAIVLSPETIAKDMEIGDADLKTAWDQHRGDYEKPERRTAEVVTAPDEPKAAALTRDWQGGADWAAMQAKAKEAGGTTVELPNAQRAEFPDPALADAVFASKQGDVQGPVKTAFGYDLVKVTSIAPGGGKTFDEAKPELRTRLIAEKSADLVDQRANKIDQLLAGGTTLEDLPADMGIGAAQGTLDAQGNTAEGTPAPIPGPAALRPALVQAAFRLKVGDPPVLTQAPNGPNNEVSYYAVQVEQITPPAPKPLKDVEEAVKEDWRRDEIHREAETQAAKLLAAVKGGQSLQDAATIAGVGMRALPPTGRSEPAEGVPSQLIQPLFGLKKGEPTMVETPDGFVVATLADIQDPDPDKDPIGFGQIRDALNRAYAQDIQASYAIAVRAQAKPKVNPAVIDQMAQAE